MSKQNRPLISVGIIFKNEIRCLERCLKSLQPLREAVPCEVVLADTGSIDGSRFVAQRYGDIVFDFPWVNDFSAARNAVMDRCSGRWYLSIDADEWLDGDIAELTALLRQGEKSKATAYQVKIRNYVTYTVNDEYAESYGLRLLWMDTGLRFQGPIHEIWPIKDAPALRHTLLHHDGYANSDSAAGKAKRARNLALLNEELERDPENLKLLLQCIESSRGMPECMEYIRRAEPLVEAEKPGWNVLGPSIFRHAVLECDERELPGLNDWIARSEERFPDSFFTRLDVNYTALRHCWKDERFGECVRRGQAYLEAMADLREGRGDQTAQSCSTIIMSSPRWAVQVKVLMASACIRENDPEQAWELLRDLDGRKLNDAQAGSMTLTLRQIHTRTQLDTSRRLVSFYEQICCPEPDEAQAEARKRAFLQEAFSVFPAEYRDYEAGLPHILRPGYTLFLPLAGVCEIGTAAAVLNTDSRAEMEHLLDSVADWSALPAGALAHAFQAGVAPSSLCLEEMDALAGRLARTKEGIVQAAIRGGAGELPSDISGLTWARALVLAAVRTCGWQDEEEGMKLCRAFSRVMAAFLPRYYGAETLEHIRVLSPYFRFGWYCVQAFEALDSGDAADYVRLLRTGLELCEEAKPVVEFLTAHTPQLQTAQASGELLALAEKVRTLLAAYAPNDPAVLVIKQSPAYQRVAHLIEGADGGGLPS